MTSADCAQCCCVPLAEQVPAVPGWLALLGPLLIVLVLGILAWLDDRNLGPPARSGRRIPRRSVIRTAGRGKDLR